MKCTRCGAETPQDFTFCPQCGTPAGEEQSAAAPVASQPIAVQPAVDFSSEPTMAVNPAAQQPPVSSQPAAPFPQQPPVSARPVNPYPPQPPVYGMPYGQPGPGVPGMPPQGMGMLPQLKSPFVKGAWFAPVAVVIALFISGGISVLLPTIFDYTSSLSLLVSSILNCLVCRLLQAAVVFGLYFAAYAKTDPIQRKKRIAVAFVPIGVVWMIGGLSGCLSSVNFWLCDVLVLYSYHVKSIIDVVLSILIMIADALIAFAIVRLFQKKLDEIQQNKG